MQMNLLPHLQHYLQEHPQCPSLDAWLADQFDDDHKAMYATLLKTRLDADGVNYPVDFDSLWPMLGYTRKDNAKTKLKKVCDISQDYMVLLQTQEKLLRGSEAIVLTFHAAQRFALQAGTARSREIADFFISALKAVQEYHILSVHYDKQQAVREATEDVMRSFLEKNKKIVYIGDLEMINGEHLVKIGSTNDGPTRIQTLKKSFPNGLRLVHIEEHPENRELETRMKRNTEVSVRQRDVTHAGKKYTECYSVDEQMTIQRYIKLVQQLAKGLEDNSQAEKMHIERMEEMSLKKMEMEVKLEHARIEHREKMRFLDMATGTEPVGAWGQTPTSPVWSRFPKRSFVRARKGYQRLSR